MHVLNVYTAVLVNCMLVAEELHILRVVNAVVYEKAFATARRAVAVFSLHQLERGCNNKQMRSVLLRGPESAEMPLP